MLRIAFIVDAFPVMSETFILNQITGLIDRGHQVDIFAVRDPREKEIPAEVERYHLRRRSFYLPGPAASRSGRLVQALVVVLGSLLRHPLKTVRALFFARHYLSFTALGYFGFVRQFFSRDYDILQAHFGPNGLRALALRDLGLKARLVTTFHGYDVTTYIRNRGSHVYDRLFERGDLFTYNSSATREKLEQLHCPPERMLKIPMGVHLDRLKFIPRTISPYGNINIISVGRLVEMKGREYAIRAVARLARNYPRLRYYIAGNGPLFGELQQLVEQLGMTGVIHLLGWVSTEKLRELYDQAHIFLHPSVTAGDGNMEGQGVVLIEAQACGLPVVATRHNAFPDSVLDGQSAFLVPERDVPALVDKLQYLLQNPHTWPAMGRCGRDFVEKNFDIEKLNDKLAAAYRELAPGNQPALDSKGERQNETTGT